VEGSCEHGNKSSGSIKCWEFLEELHNWRLLEKGSSRSEILFTTYVLGFTAIICGISAILKVISPLISIQITICENGVYQVHVRRDFMGSVKPPAPSPMKLKKTQDVKSLKMKTSLSCITFHQLFRLRFHEEEREENANAWCCLSHQKVSNDSCLFQLHWR
jgi:hypothetical protein